MQQRTINNKIVAKGVGLHKGEQSVLTLHPAEANSGIVFRRIDLGREISIKVAPDKVGETQLCTTLVENIAKIATVEHLMSALAALGIDNIIIDVSVDEIPIMDGSSTPFIFLIQAAGIKNLDAKKKFIKIKEKVEVENDIGGWASLAPHDGFSIDFGINFSAKAFNNTAKEMHFEFSTAEYLSKISRSRTFGFMKDMESLQKQNLALGATLDNAIGIDEKGILNKEGLRNKDEFVLHKILDAVGDLYMAGYSILGHFNAYKSGHDLNNILLRKLVASPETWEFVEFENSKDCPINFDSSMIVI